MYATVQANRYNEVGYLARQRYIMGYEDNCSVFDQIPSQALPAMLDIRINCPCIQVYALDNPFRSMNIESSEDIIQKKYLGISINSSSESDAGFLATCSMG